MSISFPIIYEMRLEGAEAATAKMQEVTQNFQMGIGTIDEVETAMRKMDRANSMVANSMTRTTNAFMAAHPVFSMFEQTLGRITSVARTAVSIFDSWNILQLRLNSSANGVADAADALEKAQRAVNDDIAKGLTDTPQYITDVENLTKAQRDLADKSKAAADGVFQAQIQMGLLGLVAIGQIPNILKVGIEISALGTTAAGALASVINTLGDFGKGTAIFAGIVLAISVVEDALNGFPTMKAWWDKVTKDFSSGSQLKWLGGVMSALDAFGAALGTIPALASKAWSGLMDGLNAVVAAFSSGWDTAKSDFDKLVGELTGAWAGFWGTLTSAASAAWGGVLAGARIFANGLLFIVNAIITGIDGIIWAWNASFAKIGLPTLSYVPTIPYLGSGGDITMGGSAIVGELGPELVNLPKGASVTPLSGGGGGGSTVIQNFYFPNYVGSKEDLIRVVKSGLKEEAGRHF